MACVEVTTQNQSYSFSMYQRDLLFSPVQFKLEFDTSRQCDKLQVIDTFQRPEAPKYWFCPPQSFKQTDYSQIKQLGCTLRNIANLCFLNATAQCLAYCPYFAQDCLNRRHTSDCGRQNKDQVCGFCLFEKQIEKMLKPDGFARAISWSSNLLTLLRKEIKISRGRWYGTQNCAHEWLLEFFSFLIKYDLPLSLTSKYSHGMIRLSELSTSYIHQLFSMMLQDKKICKICHHSSVSYDLSFCLHACIKSSMASVALESAIKETFEVEELVGSNMPQMLFIHKNDVARCEHCGVPREKLAARLIYKAPPVLIVLVQRLELRSYTDDAQLQHSYVAKKSTQIDVPLQFSLKSFIAPEILTDAEKNNDFVYELFGSVNHAGCSAFGHYWAIIKSPNGSFYKVDDEIFSVVPGSNLSKYLSSAYLIFYMRKDIPEEHMSNTSIVLYKDNQLSTQHQPTMDFAVVNRFANDLTSLPGGRLVCTVSYAFIRKALSVAPDSKKRPQRSLSRRKLGWKLKLFQRCSKLLKFQEMKARERPVKTKLSCTKEDNTSTENSIRTPSYPFVDSKARRSEDFLQKRTSDLQFRRIIGAGILQLPSEMNSKSLTRSQSQDFASSVIKKTEIVYNPLNFENRLSQMASLTNQYGCSANAQVETWGQSSNDFRLSEVFQAAQSSLLSLRNERSEQDKDYDKGRARKFKKKTSMPILFKEYASRLSTCPSRILRKSSSRFKRKRRQSLRLK